MERANGAPRYFFNAEPSLSFLIALRTCRENISKLSLDLPRILLYLSVDVDLVLLPLLGRFVFLLLGVKDLTVLLGSLLSLDSKISGLEISIKKKM